MRKSIAGEKKKNSVREEIEELLNKNTEENKKNLPVMNHGVMPRMGIDRGGSPCKMTPSCIAEIIERVSMGETIGRICKDTHMPAAPTVWNWVRNIPEFSQMYYEAKKFQTDVFAEEILSIADDGSSDVSISYDKYGNEKIEVNTEIVKRSEIRIKARQWLMERVNSAKYNERVMMEQASVTKNMPNMNATIKIMLPDNGRPITATFETTTEEA